MPTLRLVPQHKGDDDACANLQQASDDDIQPLLWPLLECLQDINWPIAAPVLERLLRYRGDDLAGPLLQILGGDDEVWKYWLLTNLLTDVQISVWRALRFKIHAMVRQPTPAELQEEVTEAAAELLSHWKNKA